STLPAEGPGVGVYLPDPGLYLDERHPLRRLSLLEGRPEHDRRRVIGDRLDLAIDDRAQVPVRFHLQRPKVADLARLKALGGAVEEVAEAGSVQQGQLRFRRLREDLVGAVECEAVERAQDGARQRRDHSPPHRFLSSPRYCCSLTSLIWTVGWTFV